MFEQTFVTGNARTRKPWTVAASLMAQVGITGALLIAPLLHIAAIRPVIQGPLAVRLVNAEPPHVKAVPTAARITRVRRSAVINVLAAPRSVPAHIDMTPDEPETITETAGVQFGASGIFSSLPGIDVMPPVAVKPPAPPHDAKPLTVGSGVQSAKLIYAPKPAYPAIARTARVEGTVRLMAVISREGVIENLQLIAGPPLLVAAAIEAIRQWRYQPTVLNSQPVAVSTEIDVTFTLK